MYVCIYIYIYIYIHMYIHISSQGGLQPLMRMSSCLSLARSDVDFKRTPPQVMSVGRVISIEIFCAMVWFHSIRLGLVR